METSIQISTELLNRLKIMKMYEKETYEDIIWDLIEDRLELSDETKRNLEASKKEYLEGKTKSLEQIKKELNL